jgi:hypothetical protein
MPRPYTGKGSDPAPYAIKASNRYCRNVAYPAARPSLLLRLIADARQQRQVKRERPIRIPVVHESGVGSPGASLPRVPQRGRGCNHRDGLPGFLLDQVAARR